MKFLALCCVLGIISQVHNIQITFERLEEVLPFLDQAADQIHHKQL